MIQQFIEQVRALIKEEFQKNYASGSPKIPPHTHNGVDNLRINASDVVGLTSGGGTPSGTNMQVQFNDSGSFGADAGLLYDKSILTLETNNISNVLPLTATSSLTISGTASGYYVSDVNIKTTSTSSSTGNIPNRNSGQINISTGSPNYRGYPSGDVNISTGASSGTYSNSGRLNLTTGNTTSSGVVGPVFIRPGSASRSGYTNGGSSGAYFWSVFMGGANMLSSNGNGGNVLISGGYTVLSGNGNGGDVTIKGGDRADNNGSGNTNGGLVRIRGGTGRNTGTGGAVYISGGRALSSGNNSGNINILGAGSPGTTGLGSNIYIRGGYSSSISPVQQNIGDIFIEASATGSSYYTGTGKGQIHLDAYDEITLSAATGFTKSGGLNLLSDGNISLLLGGGVSNSGHQNVFIYTSSNPGPGSGSGVVVIQNAITNPSSSPTGGGILYVDSGALKYKGSGGTVTTIANA